MRIEMSHAGSPEVLRAVALEPAEPADGEVRVAVVAAGVNPVDLWVRSGSLKRYGDWPYVPGVELVGTVEAVGPGVKLSVGDRVITMAQGLGTLRPGGYQSRAVVPASTLALLPKSLSRMEGAILGLPAVTAWKALGVLDLRAGQRLLVQAGSSAVGQYAIRLARAAGCEVAATTSRAAKVGALRDAGADEVIDTSERDWTRMREPFDAVLELVGAPTFAGSLALLRPGGRLVLADTLGGPDLRLDASVLLEAKRLTGYDASTLTAGEVQEAVDGLSRFVERGLFALPEPNRFPLAEAARAHRALESGALVGRVLLVP